MKPILDEADLRGANLRGANLRGANLRGANLSGARQLHFLAHHKIGIRDKSIFYHIKEDKKPFT